MPDLVDSHSFLSIHTLGKYQWMIILVSGSSSRREGLSVAHTVLELLR